MNKDPYKVIPIKPLNGVLDVRSSPDLMPPGSFRFRQNFTSPQSQKLCRRAGWQKLFSTSPYNNQDLHDQLLVLQNYYPDLVPPAGGADNVTVYPSGLCGTPIATRTNGREYITYMVELTSSTGFRKLVAATQSRIYELNERTGNWRILADGLGGSVDADLSIRFQSAQVKDTVIFTNDFDQPLAYQMFAPIQGCAMRALTKIPDLDTIFLSKAGCIAAWKNVMFMGNVEMDGQRLQNRIIWSDYNKPTSWDPAITEITGTIQSTLTGNVLSWNNPSSLSYLIQSRAATTDPWKEVKVVQGESFIVADPTLHYRVVSFVSSTIAGFQDLDYGHNILAITTLGDFLVVLTDKGVWQASPTGNDPSTGAAFNFRLTYSSDEGDKCLIYPNTLTSNGSSLYWLSRDGIYEYNFFMQEPDRVEWMHRASGIIFDGVASQPALNDQCCEAHVAAYRPIEKEIWVSWAVLGSCIPSVTMVFNVQQKFVDTVDAGFTCFTNYRSDSRGSLRDFMLDFCVCDAESLLMNGITYEKEGLPLPGVQPSCDIVPDCLYTTQTRNIGGNPANGQMEDYDAEPSPNSLCKAFGGRTIDDLCRDCNQSLLFVGANSIDRCLKQIGTSFNRERCTNPTAQGIIFVDANGIPTYQSAIGTYVLDGYYSIFRTQPLDYGIDAIKKQIKRLMLMVDPVIQMNPCVIQIRIGVSYDAQDPNFGYNTNPNQSQNATQGCGVVWLTILRKLLTCQSELTPAEYAAQNLVPNEAMEWALLQQGQCLYYELLIANLADADNIDGQLEPATGGESCFNAINVWVMPMTLDR